MESVRWIRFAPLVIMLMAGAVGTDVPVVAAIGDPPWDPPPCDVLGPGDARASTGAWYRLDPVLDESGTLVAQRLVVGAAGVAARRLELAPESFASGPVGGLVLVGEDDGRASRLRLLDPARGCATAMADEADVIRSSVLAADGRIAFEHRVDRASRADLGIWRRKLVAQGGSGPSATRVLDGLAPDPAQGPTFVTDLILSPDGRLAVSSCAERACRVRVLNAGSGRLGELSMVDDVGPALGVAGGRLVVRAACPGQPCELLAIDLSDGRRTTLVEAAGSAALGGSDGTEVVYAAPDGRVSVVDALTARQTVTAATDGMPLRTGSTATSGMETPPGIVAIGRDGRPGGPIVGLDPDLGVTVAIGEVRP